MRVRRSRRVRHRETLVAQLRPGSASPWNKQDHIEALDLALAQLPEHERAQVLVRTDSGGCSKAFLTHITKLGLEYSIGFPAHETVKTALQTIPAQAWRSAIDSDGNPRDGAQIAELWLQIVALAADLLAWTQTLAFDQHAPARRWEPKRLRLRLLAVAGRIIRTGRRQHLRLPRGWPWNHLIDTGYAALHTA